MRRRSYIWILDWWFRLFVQKWYMDIRKWLHLEKNGRWDVSVKREYFRNIGIISTYSLRGRRNNDKDRKSIARVSERKELVISCGGMIDDAYDDGCHGIESPEFPKPGLDRDVRLLNRSELEGFPTWYRPEGTCFVG